MDRIYQTIIQEHLQSYQQMVFLAGPRQVGKTTLLRNSKELNSSFTYYNWDNIDDREKILSGYKHVLQPTGLDIASYQKPILALDEIHKYKRWKTFLKGLYDSYKTDVRILVSGSAKLDIYRQGGDSLMGRYFLYRVHPLSLGELVRPTPSTTLLAPPTYIAQEQLNSLFTFGGFPEPFLSQDMRFYNRWQARRESQLIFEDIRALSHINDLAQLQLLAKLLKYQVGSTVKYSELAKKVRVSQPTIQAWLNVLSHFYYCFMLRPWRQNVARSLLKEPKVYLWDWSCVTEPGARVENFVSSHLLKSIQYWSDTGRGKYELYFLRTKDQKEIDFVVTENEKPWMLIEVKTSKNASLNPNLANFKESLGVPHAFQVAFDLPYMDIDALSLPKPQIIPLVSFLSQLT
jgi:predicted AAA+ superfamily ATPase